MLCFCLFCALSVFLWALVSKNSQLKLICFVSVSSVLFLSSCGPWCQKTSHLKLICFVSVSSVLFLSSCGPWCQKTLILSWLGLFLSLLCSFCLLVGLGVNKLSLLFSFCLLVGLGVKKLSSQVDLLCFSLLCSVCLLVGLGVKKTLTLS